MKKAWNEYVAYLKDNPKGYWFKRKLYGWGWTPAKPAGWAVIAVYLLIVLGLAVHAEKTGSVEEDPLGFVGLIVGLTALLIVISWRTGEPPKWQWGRKEEKDR